MRTRRRGSTKRGRRGHEEPRVRFIFGSYNAGRVPLLRAQDKARERQLSERSWSSIEIVAPKVPRWRHGYSVATRPRAANSISLRRTAPDAGSIQKRPQRGC